MFHRAVAPSGLMVNESPPAEHSGYPRKKFADTGCLWRTTTTAGPSIPWAHEVVAVDEVRLGTSSTDDRPAAVGLQVLVDDDAGAAQLERKNALVAEVKMEEAAVGPSVD